MLAMHEYALDLHHRDASVRADFDTSGASNTPIQIYCVFIMGIQPDAALCTEMRTGSAVFALFIAYHGPDCVECPGTDIVVSMDQHRKGPLFRSIK